MATGSRFRLAGFAPGEKERISEVNPRRVHQKSLAHDYTWVVVSKI
jgi:hypothetical protein